MGGPWWCMRSDSQISGRQVFVFGRVFQTGLLGAFTTFSAFSLETLQLWQAGHMKTAGINILLNVSLCLIAVVLGMALGTAVSTKLR